MLGLKQKHERSPSPSPGQQLTSLWGHAKLGLCSEFRPRAGEGPNDANYTTPWLSTVLIRNHQRRRQEREGAAQINVWTNRLQETLPDLFPARQSPGAGVEGLNGTARGGLAGGGGEGRERSNLEWSAQGLQGQQSTKYRRSGCRCPSIS